jgi:hypothetical protein
MKKTILWKGRYYEIKNDTLGCKGCFFGTISSNCPHDTGKFLFCRNIIFIAIPPIELLLKELGNG